MNEALANLYACTKNEKFLALAQRFDNHKAIMDSLAVGVDDLEGKHANTQVPKIIGAARLYELTGSKRDSAIASFFWHTVVQNHSYVNGGNSDGEHFGTPGQLNERLSTSNTETCNTYNMLKLTRHLFPGSRFLSIVLIMREPCSIIFWLLRIRMMECVLTIRL